MKLSRSLIDRIALGLTLLTGIACTAETQSAEESTGTDSVQTSIQNSSDSLTKCPPQVDSLITDSTSSEGTLTITKDYCPPCGMG